MVARPYSLLDSEANDRFYENTARLLVQLPNFPSRLLNARDISISVAKLIVPRNRSPRGFRTDDTDKSEV